MKVTQTELDGVVIVEPAVHGDGRGFFVETYRQDRYSAAGLPATFVQDNHSSSRKGTLRGLHAQRNYPQGKLVRTIEGEIFDVAVDIRKGSKTFGRWVSAILTAESFRQLYVPPGFLHGFCVISEQAQVEYKCTDFYHPEDEIGVVWNDPQIGIEWPVPAPVVSDKDRNASTLNQWLSDERSENFVYGEGLCQSSS